MIRMEQQLQDCFDLVGFSNMQEQLSLYSTYLLEEWDDDYCLPDEFPEFTTARKLEVCIDAILYIRKKGVFPFYTARLIALFFLQEHSDDVFLQEIASFVAQVGILHAIHHYTKLDREVDITQLICERYTSLKDGTQFPVDHDVVRKVKEAYTKAFKAEVDFHGCSQCVLLGLGSTFNEVPPQVFKSATSLSGGIAQCGDGACGAYSGAIMYMDLFMGRSLEQLGGDKTDQYHSFSMAQRLHDKFVETYGGVRGMDVHKALFKTWYLLRDPIQKQAFSTAGAHELGCPSVVGNAARWAAEILLEEKLV